MSDQVDSEPAIAFVGTYGPRRCGIASFTGSLAAAVAGNERRVWPMVLAVTDPSGQYQYPSEVTFEIRQNHKADYARAAEFVNYSHVRLVSIQHEYGIFGGDDGSYILDFVHGLRVPAIGRDTCSSGLDNQAAIVHKLAVQCAQIVVMSQWPRICSRARMACRIEGSDHSARNPRDESQPKQEVLKGKFGVPDDAHAHVRLAQPEGLERDRALPRWYGRTPTGLLVVVATPR